MRRIRPETRYQIDQDVKSLLVVLRKMGNISKSVKRDIALEFIESNCYLRDEQEEILIRTNCR